MAELCRQSSTISVPSGAPARPRRAETPILTARISDCRSQPGQGYSETLSTSLRLPDAPRESRQEGLGEPRHVLEKRGELPAADDEEANR